MTSDISIVGAFDFLRNVLRLQAGVKDGDMITIYVPSKIYEKLIFELSQVQKIPEMPKGGSSFNREMVLNGLFIIRPQRELEYLEGALSHIRRIVT